MPRKPSYADLEDQVRVLRQSRDVYFEAYRALRVGETPVRITAGEGDHACTIDVIALTRAHGGIVLHVDSNGATYLDTWMRAAHDLAEQGIRYADRDVADKAAKLREARFDSMKRSAKCDVCKRSKAICCDRSNVANADGSITYDEPICMDCCPQKAGPHLTRTVWSCVEVREENHRPSGGATS